MQTEEREGLYCLLRRQDPEKETEDGAPEVSKVQAPLFTSGYTPAQQRYLSAALHPDDSLASTSDRPPAK